MLVMLAMWQIYQSYSNPLLFFKDEYRGIWTKLVHVGLWRNLYSSMRSVYLQHWSKAAFRKDQRVDERASFISTNCRDWFVTFFKLKHNFRNTKVSSCTVCLQHGRKRASITGDVWILPFIPIFTAEWCCRNVTTTIDWMNLHDIVKLC